VEVKSEPLEKYQLSSQKEPGEKKHIRVSLQQMITETETDEDGYMGKLQMGYM